MARAKRDDVSDYHIRQVPTKELERMKARARRDGLSMRDVFISAAKAYNRGELSAEKQD